MPVKKKATVKKAAAVKKFDPNSVREGDYILAKMRVVDASLSSVEGYVVGDENEEFISLIKEHIVGFAGKPSFKPGTRVRCTNCNGVGTVRYVIGDMVWIQNDDPDDFEDTNGNHIEKIHDLVLA